MPPGFPFRRRHERGQTGSEMIEFALITLFLVTALLWSFVNAMNLVRMNEANQVTRDIGNLYIHGVDYSTYQAQSVAQVLAKGFNLQIGNSFSGNDATNNGNSGNAYVIVAQVMFIGSGTCSSLDSGVTCTNQNQYAYTQYLNFGNASLQINNVTVSSSLGTPTFPGTGSSNCGTSEACINSSGIVSDFVTGANAACTNCASFFQTQLSDGQVAYIVETFFASPDLSFSSFPGGGIHSINFF
jgi:hypothetical protein